MARIYIAITICTVGKWNAVHTDTDCVFTMWHGSAVHTLSLFYFNLYIHVLLRLQVHVEKTLACCNTWSGWNVLSLSPHHRGRTGCWTPESQCCQNFHLLDSTETVAPGQNLVERRITKQWFNSEILKQPPTHIYTQFDEFWNGLLIETYIVFCVSDLIIITIEMWVISVTSYFYTQVFYLLQ